MKRLFFYFTLISAVLASCSDDDSFTTSRSALLTFSEDVIDLDTVFSTVPTSTYTFWVYNRNSDGVRLRQVRLLRGNQSGFRVNVDGIYLDNTLGSVAGGFEIPKGDSIRVFVELTSAPVNSDKPELVSDDLVFILESGVEQRVALCAYSWDAIMHDSIVVSRDTVIAETKPVIIRKGIKVEEGATLTICAPTSLYFYSGAGIDVYGRLLVNPGQVAGSGDVVFRGDRLDRMFDYLPYDRVSGQWLGITIHRSSSGNDIVNADIHSAEHGIVCDSADYDDSTLRLLLENVTIHNCKGPGLLSYNSNIALVNCQFSNTLGDCVAVHGGRALLLYCTLAQFYPFSGDRGVALRFTNFADDRDYPLYMLECYNTIITGYAADEVMGMTRDKGAEVPFAYYFENVIIRTPEEEEMKGAEQYVNVIFETPDDEIQGKDHFVSIDEDNLSYDFHLDSLSTAIGKGRDLPAYSVDRDGIERGDKPDLGCYQYVPHNAGATSARR